MKSSEISSKDKQARKEFDRKLGHFLREKREASELTQSDISKVLGLTTSQFISNIERGLCSVPTHVLKIMIEKYKLNSNSFLVYLSELKMDYYKQVLQLTKHKKVRSRRP